MSDIENLKIKKSDFQNSSFKELSIIKKFIFWVDIIPTVERNNNAIFARPFNKKNAIPQQLKDNNFLIKSNFHGYGGNSYQCLEVNEKIYLVWIDQISKALWLQILKVQVSVPENDNGYFLCDTKPRQLTQAIECNFDASFIVSKNNLLYGLCEIKNTDYLFSLNLKKTKQQIRKIKKFDNFVGNLSSNPTVKLFSWIEWKNNYMPCEKNHLFFCNY